MAKSTRGGDNFMDNTVNGMKEVLYRDQRSRDTMCLPSRIEELMTSQSDVRACIFISSQFWWSSALRMKTADFGAEGKSDGGLGKRRNETGQHLLSWCDSKCATRCSFELKLCLHDHNGKQNAEFHKIGGYPTLVAIKNNKRHNFDQTRTKHNIDKFITTLTTN